MKTDGTTDLAVQPGVSPRTQFMTSTLIGIAAVGISAAQFYTARQDAKKREAEQKTFLVQVKAEAVEAARQGAKEAIADLIRNGGIPAAPVRS